MNTDLHNQHARHEFDRLELAYQFTNARNDCDISLRALAQSTGIGLQTLVRIEAGSGGVGLANLQTALAAVGLQIKLVKQLRTTAK